MNPPVEVVVMLCALAVGFTQAWRNAPAALTSAFMIGSFSEKATVRTVALLTMLGAFIGAAVLPWSLARSITAIGAGPLLARPAHDPRMLLGTVTVVMLTAVAGMLVLSARGLPSSMWQAVMGAFAGAALAWPGATPHLRAIAGAIGVMTAASILATGAAWIVARVLARWGRNEVLRAHHVPSALTLTAALTAVFRAVHDARLPLTIAVIAAGAGAQHPQLNLTVTAATAVAMGAGTMLAGRRIMRTVGWRLTEQGPREALAAQSATALTLGIWLLAPLPPLSVTQVFTGAVTGAGLSNGTRWVRWPVAARIAAVWVLSPLACAGVAGLATMLLRPALST